MVRKKPACVLRLNVGWLSSGWKNFGRPHSPMRLNSVKNPANSTVISKNTGTNASHDRYSFPPTMVG